MSDEFIISTTSVFNGDYDILKIWREREKIYVKSKPVFFVVDWCAGSGYVRGDVIKRAGNVVHVRFKTLL